MGGGNLTINRNTDLDALRGAAVCLVVSSHFFWIFFPNLTIGNFHAIDALSETSPFPLFNILFPNVFAVAVLLAVSGYASVVAFAARPARPALLFDVSQRYLRFVIPAIAAGALAYFLSIVFNDANVAASAIIFGSGIPTWLGGLWSETPTLRALAAEFLLGRVSQEASILPVLWMMPDLFAGSVAALLGLRFVPARYATGAFLAVGVLALFVRPLMAAVILGALVGLVVRSRPAMRIPVGIRLSVLFIALVVGLNPKGSGTGGLALQEWYAPWLPDAAAWPAMAVAGVLVLVALLPRQSAITGPTLPHRVLGLMASIGKRSYGLYLLHLPVLLTFASATFVFMHEATGPTTAMIATLLATLVPLTIMVPLFDRVIEGPVTRRLRALGR